MQMEINHLLGQFNVQGQDMLHVAKQTIKKMHWLQHLEGEEENNVETIEEDVEIEGAS